jgi:hypothetical protein
VVRQQQEEEEDGDHDDDHHHGGGGGGGDDDDDHDHDDNDDDDDDGDALPPPPAVWDLASASLVRTIEDRRQDHQRGGFLGGGEAGMVPYQLEDGTYYIAALSGRGKVRVDSVLRVILH